MGVDTRRCTRCGQNRATRFFTGARGRICATCRKKTSSAASHETRVQKTYGLLPGEYLQLLLSQDSRCAICKQTRKQRLAVDHDHKTGMVRGLLCKRCNGVLLARGCLDNPEILMSGYLYLTNPPAPGVIGERFAPEQ